MKNRKAIQTISLNISKWRTQKKQKQCNMCKDKDGAWECFTRHLGGRPYQQNAASKIDLVWSIIGILHLQKKLFRVWWGKKCLPIGLKYNTNGGSCLGNEMTQRSTLANKVISIGSPCFPPFSTLSFKWSSPQKWTLGFTCLFWSLESIAFPCMERGKDRQFGHMKKQLTYMGATINIKGVN